MHTIVITVNNVICKQEKYNSIQYNTWRNENAEVRYGAKPTNCFMEKPQKVFHLPK